MRKCSKCSATLPLEQFRFRPDKGLHLTACRSCERAAQLVNYVAKKQRDPIGWRVGALRSGRSKEITLAWLEQTLKQQGGVCALSGRPISIMTLEVDHIVPRRDGGSNGLSNLQLVCREANAAKGALSESELIALCQDILGHRAILRVEAANQALSHQRAA